jgi:hypothetical protein
MPKFHPRRSLHQIDIGSLSNDLLKAVQCFLRADSKQDVPDAHDSFVGGKPDFIIAGRLQSRYGNSLTVHTGNFSNPDAIEICVGNL